MADRRHEDDTVREEASALGERTKGAIKDATGAVTGNERLEREGELENARGRARQATNDVFDETDGVRERSVHDESVRNYGAGSGTVSEEMSAAAQRTKGAVKDKTGAVLGLEGMEREGERENALGRARQAANDAVDVDSPVTAGDRRFVTNLYDRPEDARSAYDELTSRHGYRAEDVSVMLSDDTRRQHFGDVKTVKTGSKAAEGAGVGGATGIGVGAALGALVAAATSIAIPGLGLIVAGPIAGAIAGAGAGAAAGTLVGALIGAGIPEEKAKVYDEGIRRGGVVLGTKARTEAEEAELERYFAEHGRRNTIS